MKKILFAITICVCSGYLYGYEKGLTLIFPPKKILMTRESWQSLPLKPEVVFDKFLSFDAVWCSELIAERNIEAWDYLRKNSNILFLYYTVGNSVRVVNDFTFLDYDYINENHPEWFLLKNFSSKDTSVSNRIRWRVNPSDVYYNRFYLDVGNEQFQNWAAEQYLEMVKGHKYSTLYSFDGIAMDNVHTGHRRFYGLNKDYPDWKYKNDIESWNNSFFKYLSVVKKKLNENGYILVANHMLDHGPTIDDSKYWLKMYESVDGCMAERALRFKYGFPLYADDHWELAIRNHEKLLERGLIDWWICHPQGSGDKYYNEFLYTYCSWLLIRADGLSYYYATGEKVGGRHSFKYQEEYDLSLGVPVSKRYRKNGCWLREYQYAKIVVNPTQSSQIVEIDNSNLWLEWSSKKLFKKIEIPAKSGMILLPTAYKDIGKIGSRE